MTYQPSERGHVAHEEEVHGQLFNPNVFSSWQRIREIIGPAYQRITKYPLAYEVQLVDRQGLRPFVEGFVEGGKATVALPLEPSPSEIACFYAILFHELGHLTFIRGERNPVTSFFEKTAVPHDYLSDNANDFFRMLCILHLQNGQVVEDAWSFERMVDESRADIFSLLLGSSIFEKATLKLFARDARDKLIASSEYYNRDSALGADFQKSIVVLALLRKNEGDTIKTMEDVEGLTPSELAQLVLDLARSEGMLAVVANVNEFLSKRYCITPFVIERTEVTEEDLGAIGKKRDRITNILKAVSAPEFDKKVQRAFQFYSTNSTLEFIRALVQKDYDRAVQTLEEMRLREKDRVLFLLADTLYKDNPQASQRLFQKVVDAYPQSPWRYRAQHRIKG